MKTSAFVMGLVLSGASAGFAQDHDIPRAAAGRIEQAALQPIEQPSVEVRAVVPIEPSAAITPDTFPGPGDLPDMPGLPPVEVGRLRDPFRPFTMDLQIKKDDDRFLTPLQRYDLQQLSVVGVMLDLEPPRAMVEDDSGMGFIVKPGTGIGRQGGVVTDIKTRQIIVQETFLDFYGREQARKVVLEMPRDQESDQ